MALTCRMVINPGGEVLSYSGVDGDTYETALLSFRIVPDTVLIIYGGFSLPQDKPIEEEEVEIILTAGMGCCCWMKCRKTDHGNKTEACIPDNTLRKGR